jgi:hypothetical protein
LVDARRQLRYQRNKQAILRQQHAYRERLRLEWREGIKSTAKIQRKAEEVAFPILDTNGFDEVQRMSYQFPFDYLARKNGKLFAIEVTTSMVKRFLKRIHSRHPRRRKDFTWRLDFDRVEFAKFIGARIAVIFVTPSLKRYFLLLDPTFKEGKTARFQSAQIQGLLSQLT